MHAIAPCWMTLSIYEVNITNSTLRVSVVVYRLADPTRADGLMHDLLPYCSIVIFPWKIALQCLLMLFVMILTYPHENYFFLEYCLRKYRKENEIRSGIYNLYRRKQTSRETLF